MAVDLPPPSYWFLVGLTLLAYPFVLRAASPPMQRVVRHVVLSLVLFELALVLLFYSRLVCWMLAGVASVSLLVAGPRRAPAGLVGLQSALALAAGLVFQFTQDLGYLLYFAIGLPVVMGVPLAWFVGVWLRYDADWRTHLAAFGVMLFGGWIAVSAFARDFLVSFEILHLPVLLVALTSLALLAGRGWPRVAAAVRGARGVPDASVYLSRPVVGAARGVGALALAFASLVAFAVVGQDLGGAVVAVALGALALAALGRLVAARAGARSAWARASGPAVLFLAVVMLLLITLLVAYQAYFGDAPDRWRALLALGGTATTLILFAFAETWSLAAELSARAAVAESRVHVPVGALRETATTTPDVAALRRFAHAVAGANAVSGVLVVAAPPDPLWTLPDDVHEWLVSQRNPDVRVHVAIEAPEGVYTIPEVWPEEHDA